MRNHLLAAVLSVGALAAPCGGAWAGPTNLLLNGSFESFADGVFTNWTNSGSQGVTPTQYATPHPTDGVTPGQFGDVVSPDPFTASPDAAGKQGAYFVADRTVGASGNNEQRLSQAVSLAKGVLYEVGFDLFKTISGAGNSGFFTLTDSIGNVVLSMAPDSNTAPGTWEHFASTFSLAGFSGVNKVETFSLNFRSGAAPAQDVIIDKAYIMTVPEPASLAALGAGLAGIGLYRQRRRSEA